MPSTIKLRSIGDFLDLKGFAAAESGAYYDRLTLNLLYYRTNYLFLFILALLTLCIAGGHVYLLVLILIIIAADCYVLIFRPNNAFYIVNRAFSVRFVIISTFFICNTAVLYYCGLSYIITAVITSIIIIIHSSYRARPFGRRGRGLRGLRGLAALRGMATMALSQSSNKRSDVTDVDEDEDDTDGDSEGVDEENPQTSDLKKQQAQFRANFRAQMREKYRTKD